MIFPDFAFGYDHRDYLPPALKAQGAEVIAQIAIPPTESSFTKYFPQIPADTEVIYHVMVGPAVLTFVKELGEFYGSNRPQLFGFIDSLEAVDINSPGLEFLDGSHFWEGSPRYAQDDDTDAQKAYRAAVGIDDNGAAVGDAKDVSTAAHMFGCWETLYVIKKAMEDAGYKGPEDRAKLVEATEALTEFAEGPEHPQGDKTFNGKIHQCFGHQNISKVEGGKLKVVHRPRSRTASTSRKATTRRSRCELRSQLLVLPSRHRRHSIRLRVGRSASRCTRPPWPPSRRTEWPSDRISCSPRSKAWSPRPCWR